MSYSSPQSPGNRQKPGAEKNGLMQDAEDKAGAFADGAVQSASAVIQKGRHMAEDVGEQAKAAGKDIAARIKDNPFTAIGIAFGAGVLFALLRK
jgi:ElaB/YqjD/DUF883 family membrane-anchored ribosome-binding protein